MQRRKTGLGLHFETPEARQAYRRMIDSINALAEDDQPLMGPSIPIMRQRIRRLHAQGKTTMFDRNYQTA